ERADESGQACGGGRVGARLHGVGPAGAESSQGAEQAGGGPLEDRPQFGQVVLHGGAGEGDARGGGQAAQRACGGRGGVLDVLSLVGGDQVPGDSGEPCGVDAQGAVGGEGDGAGFGGQFAVAAVEAVDRGGGGEAADLPFPVAQQGRRAHHEGGSGLFGPFGPQQVQRDEGDGLAESHVVGQAAAQAQPGHAVQPAQSAQLVVAQGGGQGCWRGHWLLSAVGIAEEFPQPLQPSCGRQGHLCAVDLDGSG